MTKSLLAGAVALTLIASAAWAQAYDSTVSRTTTTQVAPVDTTSTTTRTDKTVDPTTGTTLQRTQTTRTVAPVTSTTTTTTAANPGAFDPSHVTTYHEERTLGPGPQTTEKTYTSETASPTQQTTTYSRSSTTTTKPE